MTTAAAIDLVVHHSVMRDAGFAQAVTTCAYVFASEWQDGPEFLLTISPTGPVTRS